MQTRRLGKTDHMSSILAFGAFALFHSSDRESDQAIASALERGINHFDVSPIYGKAEKCLGSWIKRHGKNFFLGCKTAERTQKAAWEGLQRSLDTLNSDCFDLFQFHGVDDPVVLDTILGPGGAMEAVLEAKRQGLVRYIGITGHRPDVQKLALERFDFDTVMFPLNRIHAAHRHEWNDFRPLLEIAREKDVGVMAIKAVAKGTWSGPEAARKFQTWYEPFVTPDEIQKSLWFTLSQDIDSAVLPGDFRLWPTLLDAVDRFHSLDEAALKEIVAMSEPYRPLVGPIMD